MAEYYVDNVDGSDANAGTSEGSGNAWGSLSHSFSATSAGDIVWIKGGTDYVENVTTLSTGSLYSWVEFKGYTSTTGDSGYFTVEASGGTNGISSSGNKYLRFENMIVENATGDGVGGTFGWVALINCEFNNNGGMGVLLGSNVLCGECSFAGNTSTGAQINSGQFMGCTAYSNGAQGLRLAWGSGGGVYNESFSNASSALNGGGGVWIHNTCDGDAKDSNNGINQGTSTVLSIINNVVYDCGVGITRTAGCRGEFGRNNLLYDNTTDYSGWGESERENDITGTAPGFEDEGNNDYSLASGSAARNAGFDVSGAGSPGADIGAHQSADAQSGGTRIIITG